MALRYKRDYLIDRTFLRMWAIPRIEILLVLADTGCSWNSVNVFFLSLLNDPELPNNNWYRLHFHFPHSGDFKLYVLILREFLDYLNWLLLLSEDFIFMVKVSSFITNDRHCKWTSFQFQSFQKLSISVTFPSLCLRLSYLAKILANSCSKSVEYTATKSTQLLYSFC